MMMNAMGEAWRLLPSGGTLFCGVSGGIDSMVLLHAAVRFRRQNDPHRPLSVLHLNHSLRGKESDLDEEFVQSVAASLGLEFHSARLSWEGERPTQASCRARRLEFFRKTLRAPEDRIFLAHHQGDQAETILMRMIRGSGLRGLKGMAPVSGKMIRPFLDLSRGEIEAAASDWGVEWREDSSNESAKYERNWIRHEVMPLLEKRRPGASKKIAALAAELRALPLSENSPSSFSGEGWQFFRTKEVMALGGSDLSRIFRLSRMHTMGLISLLKKGSGRYSAEGISFHLSAGLLLAMRGEFVLEKAELVKKEQVVEIKTILGHWSLQLEAGERVGLQNSLGLGDRVKKEFQRAKVPVFFREHLPLLVRKGRPYVLLPGHSGVKIDLSPLGTWWLSPS